MKIKNTLQKERFVLLLFFFFIMGLCSVSSQQFVEWNRVQRAKKITGEVNVGGSVVSVTVETSSSTGAYYTGVKGAISQHEIISTIEGKNTREEIKYLQGFVYPKTYDEAKLTQFNQMFEIKKSPRCLPTILTFKFSRPVQIKEIFVGDLDAIQIRYMGCGTERLYYINSHDESFYFRGVHFSSVSPGEMLQQDFEPDITTSEVVFKKPSKVQEDRNGYDYAVFTTSTRAITQFQIVFTGWDEKLAECGDEGGLISRSNALNYFALKVGSFKPFCGTSPPKVENLQTICAQNQPIIADLRAVGEQLRWYRRITGGNPLPLNKPLLENEKYFVSQTIGGCESERIGVRVQFYHPHTDKAITGREVICVGEETMYRSEAVVDGRWLSSDKEIIQIDEYGVAYAKKRGKATITYIAAIADKWCDSLQITKQIEVVPMPTLPQLLSVVQPQCSYSKGQIVIKPQQDVLYSLDGENWQKSNSFTVLDSKKYSLFVKSEKGNCTLFSESITINPPPPSLEAPTLHPVSGDDVISTDEKNKGILLSGKTMGAGEVIVFWGVQKKKIKVVEDTWKCFFTSDEIPEFKKSIIVVEYFKEGCSKAINRVVAFPKATGGASIIARDDNFREKPVPFLDGNNFVGNVFFNDSINDLPVSREDVLLEIKKITLNGEPIDIKDSSIQIDEDGVLSVAPESSQGHYKIIYTICDKFVPLVCDDALVSVIVDADCEKLFRRLETPQFLSANRDGKNEKWELEGLYPYNKACGPLRSELYIFNRFGKVVYKKQNYMSDEERFRASVQGETQRNLPTGTYFFIFKVEGGGLKTGFIYITTENNLDTNSSF